jgi:hypothetical protein
MDTFWGYVILLWDSLKIDFLIGGGYAPVSQEVKIDNHINEGDFYPLLNIQLFLLAVEKRVINQSAFFSNFADFNIKIFLERIFYLCYK